jgi:hypothetical protein
MSAPTSPLPVPARERWPLAVAAATALAGALILVLAVGRHGPARPAATVPATPAVVIVVPSPTPAGAAPAAPAPAQVTSALDEQRFAANDRAHVRADWVAKFYPIYAAAQRAFGVNWLLIASVHKQETAFSTHPTTYRGLNFANCCAGPMQFNVTNGPSTTWDRYREAWRRAERPGAYPHRTDQHPSVYDDFDAVMAAGALLRDSGAGVRLDATAWRAAYDYYRHDLSGVDYADQVVARALGWGRSRFCINCRLEPALVGAVAAAWGDPVRGELSKLAAKELAAKERAAKGRPGGAQAKAAREG